MCEGFRALVTRDDSWNVNDNSKKRFVPSWNMVGTESEALSAK